MRARPSRCFADEVDIVGMVENMSYFVCPHCQHEVDIFSRGGAENGRRS